MPPPQITVKRLANEAIKLLSHGWLKRDSPGNHVSAYMKAFHEFSLAVEDLELHRSELNKHIEDRRRGDRRFALGILISGAIALNALATLLGHLF